MAPRMRFLPILIHRYTQKYKTLVPKNTKPDCPRLRGETPFSDFISLGIFAVFCNLSMKRLLLRHFHTTAFRLLRDPPAMRRKANLPDRTCADMRRRELVAKSCNPPADKFHATIYLPLSKLRNSPHQRPPDDVGTHIFAPQPAIRSAGETPRKNASSEVCEKRS